MTGATAVTGARSFLEFADEDIIHNPSLHENDDDNDDDDDDEEQEPVEEFRLIDWSSSTRAFVDRDEDADQDLLLPASSTATASTETAYSRWQQQQATVANVAASRSSSSSIRRRRGAFGSSSSSTKEEDPLVATTTTTTMEDLQFGSENEEVSYQPVTSMETSDDDDEDEVQDREDGLAMEIDDNVTKDHHNDNDSASTATVADRPSVEGKWPVIDVHHAPTMDGEEEKGHDSRTTDLEEHDRDTSPSYTVAESTKAQDEDTNPSTLSAVSQLSQRTDPNVTEPGSPPHQPPSLSVETLLQRVDREYRTVTDKTQVTVKHILVSIEHNTHCTLDKHQKKLVRNRLMELIEQEQQDEEDSSSKEGGSERMDVEDEDDRSRSSASDSDNDNKSNAESDDDEEERPESEDDSDEEYQSSKKGRSIKKTKKSAPTKAKNHKSSKTSKSRDKNKDSSKRLKPPRRLSKDIKVKAMRIHAETLRKRRMEELRVRNEELQVQQSNEDQIRSEQIAAKFDTNTDEDRWKRLEQRLGLLSQLDQKRLIVVQQETIIELDDEDDEDDNKSDSGTKVKSESHQGDESDESDDELEIEGSVTLLAPHMPKQAHAVQLLDLADHAACRYQLKQHIRSKKVASPSKSLQVRAALKHSLLQKRKQQSNLWLARELGYKNEKEHLRDCLLVEQRKQQLIRKKEQERLERNRQLRERLMEGGELEEDETAEDHQDNPNMDQEEGAATSDREPDDDEEDEEMALARELEQSRLENPEPTVDGDDDEAGPSCLEDDVLPQVTADADGESVVPPTSESKADTEVDTTSKGLSSAHGSVDTPQEAGQDTKPVEDALELTSEDIVVSEEPTTISEVDGSPLSDSENVDPTVEASKDETGPESSQPKVETVATSPKPKKPQGPRNLAWKAMLEKEAAQARKMKKTKSGLVEDEADEEEDEQEAGLEDFGFAIHKKKKPDDEENDDDFNEDDLKHVVDELSDDEGDEDAGEKARKALEKLEEKKRHKEILRRMRDGYDGRRGGIAGGGFGARGVHRFDELVAADNREDAKRLGLLNDDELNSDDEEGEKKSGDDEEEDEAALLDKMLKDRFLHRSSVEIEENFSDDEEESLDEEAAAGDGQDDDEDREQERLAKRFAKRARMQRLIEAHAHEEEFSRSKLIDEDASLKVELQKMKNGLGRKRSSSAISSQSSSTTGSGPSKKLKNVAFASGFLQGGSLAIALQANSRNKSKTTFLRTGSTAGAQDASSSSSSFQRSVSLNHSVFSNSNSSFGCAKAGSKAVPRSTSIPGRPLPVPSKAPSSTSLWSRAVAPTFRKPN